MKTFLVLIVLCAFLIACRTVPQQTTTEEEPFCGSSSDAACATDSDCVTDGCSGQICRSNTEEPRITSCEWRDCYDAQAYGLVCSCLEQKCEWHETYS